MNRNDKIELLQALTDEKDEKILSSYLLLAKSKLLNHLYPFGNGDKIPPKYEMVQVEIAAHLISRIGMEGETARTENGVVHEFENGDIPDRILKKVIPFAGVFHETASEESEDD